MDMLQCSVIIAAMKMPPSKNVFAYMKCNFSAAGDRLNRVAHAGMKPISTQAFDDVRHLPARLHSMNTYAA